MKFREGAIRSLRELGYTEREAEFLCIVAIHSGFFLQRQFMQFVDVAGRGPATYFIKKAIQNKHVREHLPERGTQKVYHLFSRTIYATLGRENSRHRKAGRYGLLEKAAVRTLGLDFVLSHLGCQFLEEEADKVAYFTRGKGMSADALPATVYRGQYGTETRHYFVENFPIFLAGDDHLSSVNFTYIEDDIRSLQTFASFVRRYRPLFDGLDGNFKLIFVSNSTRSFQSAKQIFVNVLSGVGLKEEQQRLARFFRLRQMAEQKRFKELVHREVIDWQQGLKRYSDPRYEIAVPKLETNWEGFPMIENRPAISNPGDHFETFLAIPNVGRLGPTSVGEGAQSIARLPHGERSA